MDHAQAVLAGTEEATVEDFIEWQEEMSRRTGEIGFSMGSWDSDEVCDVWNNLIENENASETQIHDVSEPQWETSLDEFLKQNHQEDFQWLQRMKMMQANKSLFSKTVLEVHRRLLQEGKTQQDIEHYITTKTPLRHQIMHLRQLEHPTPQKPVGGVDVWLVLGPKPEHREIISLPVKASLNEVSKLLEGFKKSAMMFLEDSSTTQPADQEQPTWQYRIVTGPPWTPASKRVKLRDDADYQKMVRGLISKRSVKIMALIEEVNPQPLPLTPEQRATQRALELGFAEHGPAELLDRNGEPFFQPVDWDVVGRKAQEGKSMNMDEASLDALIKEMVRECDL